MSKSILISGASSGIGRELAVLMAREGWNLALTGRSQSKLEETSALCRHAAPGVCTWQTPCDISDSKAAGHAVNAAAAHFGGLDALANVAGHAPMTMLSELSDETVRECLAVNLEAVMWTTRAAWPLFKARGSGVVVNVSSLASVDPFPGFNVYAAAKAGVNLFTQATAKEGESFGIRAYAVAPGCVETPMLRGLFGTDLIPADKCLSPVAVASVLRDCVLGRRPEKSGEVIWLPSP